MSSKKESFRILSLDGGGTRGLLSAQILTNIEDYLNNKEGERVPLGQRFDFIVGTSTGGLIALGLAAGKRASQIRDLYLEIIPKVFSTTNRDIRYFLGIGPKYKTGPLKEALTQFFEEKTLENVSTDVCITSIALSNAKPRLYKSDYLARNRERFDEKLADIALATSAAPTYFLAHSLKHSSNLIDGGICANNPALIGLVDTFNFERPSKRGTEPKKEFSDISRKNTVLLSIGTGDQGEMPYRYSWLKYGSILYWGKNFHEVSIASQSQLIHFQAKFLLGDNYLRINPPLKFSMKLDDAKQAKELLNYADITHEIEDFLKSRF
ncbi:CBASS cGAMP-activated phospholipase [Nitrospina gracilis]|uniref:CBASS cGAMP-activated phospholipase n=1 Tax=Nitrospina gracilis TaxID=35801 RepID=UPI001F41B737|nr:CBASS cGAMP-activated phospholipase [Nitrospina gracilis]MCF8721775.1 patatin-like phospholipase/acyl hydrolase [Nitrospina gracilis Nb-211]